ncbi:SANT DNA-binding domain-containing protein [Blumeria hordei DH14]|uniref:SANT DNA-binding domain-containing protein n=1 Tax=Blumeria graminis f. sp. hordei (strain DH14) TaxID=546991 RepID=N1J6A0_BLUG1|nr:SANT DNA-binding domain-containing protein [Blumeria hordei DH14]
MSNYRPGHELGHDPYISYATHSHHNTDERVYVPHASDTRHESLNSIHEPHLGAHSHAHQHQTPAVNNQPHSIYTEHEMAHPSSQYGSSSSGGGGGASVGGQRMIYGPPRPMQLPLGIKRQRPSDIEPEVNSMSSQQIHHGAIQNTQAQIPQKPTVFHGQTIQAYHTHPLPHQGHRSKIPRLSDDESIAGPSAPSVVGMEGMPSPAPRPRGPKLKFTPEDDALLVDLKEVKSLTWKQIADFFPGRSSGTLQVRYCTKLKAKSTQWTEETVQKLRTALHDYEQEKWRIVAQKVGTGFTSAACKEKAAEL